MIDVDLPAAGCDWDENLLSDLLGELMSDPLDTIIAYRHGERWVQNFEPVRLQEPTGTMLREGGVYLITGGLGNTCLALAEELARAVRAKLVLIGRSGFPARAEWSEWLRNRGENDRVSRKIRKLQALEILGSDVMVCSADVADGEQMQSVLSQARSRFGEIHGVIHGAGTIAAESFFGVDVANQKGCELHFRAKGRGIMVLEQLFAGKPLDFVLLLSSLSSILAGIGFVAYAAGNAFLDAFAAAARSRGVTRWLSVNWDNWSFDENDATGEADASMRLQEGVETFRRIMAPTAPRQVAVSTTDLQTRIDQWINFRSASAKMSDGNPARHSRPDLATEHVPPRNEVEQIIGKIWEEVLGIEPVGVHDNFLELGGQSLLATQVVARLRTAFKTELPVRRLFEKPTVAELALAVAPEPEQTAKRAEPAERAQAQVLA